MLVEEREIDEISVTDLATAAGVTRMTFYQYFPDKGALLQAAGIARFEEALTQFDDEGDSPSFDAVLVRLFRHYAEHRTFYRRLDEGGGLQVHLAVQAYVSDRIGSSSLFAANALQHDEETFLGGGAMAFLRTWLDEQHSAPDAAESGAAELGRLIRIYASALNSDSPEPRLRASHA